MTIHQADIDKFKTMGKATTKAVGQSYQATQLSLEYHAQYLKALKLNTKAQKACSDWYDYVADFGKQAQGNNAWFKKAYAALAAISPAQQTLVADRKLLTADMLAHTKLSLGDATSTEAAAGEADKQAARSGRSIPKDADGGERGIDSIDPTEEEPVILNEEMSTGTKIGLFAAAGLFAAWLARRVMS